MEAHKRTRARFQKKAGRFLKWKQERTGCQYKLRLPPLKLRPRSGEDPLFGGRAGVESQNATVLSFLCQNQRGAMLSLISGKTLHRRNIPSDSFLHITRLVIRARPTILRERTPTRRTSACTAADGGVAPDVPPHDCKFVKKSCKLRSVHEPVENGTVSQRETGEDWLPVLAETNTPPFPQAPPLPQTHLGLRLGSEGERTKGHLLKGKH